MLDSASVSSMLSPNAHTSDGAPESLAPRAHQHCWYIFAVDCDIGVGDF